MFKFGVLFSVCSIESCPVVVGMVFGRYGVVVNWNKHGLQIRYRVLDLTGLKNLSGLSATNSKPKRVAILVTISVFKFGVISSVCSIESCPVVVGVVFGRYGVVANWDKHGLQIRYRVLDLTGLKNLSGLSATNSKPKRVTILVTISVFKFGVLSSVCSIESCPVAVGVVFGRYGVVANWNKHGLQIRYWVSL